MTTSQFRVGNDGILQVTTLMLNFLRCIRHMIRDTVLIMTPGTGAGGVDSADSCPEELRLRPELQVRELERQSLADSSGWHGSRPHYWHSFK